MSSQLRRFIGMICLSACIAPSSTARAQPRQSSQYSVETLTRQRLWWDDMDLIADYNQLLNEMLLENLPTGCARDPITKAQNFLLDYTVKEQLGRPQTMQTLDAIEAKILNAEEDLADAKDAWLRCNHLDEKKVAVDLQLNCTQKVLDSSPLPGQDQRFYEDLIHQCATRARATLNGIAVTYNGTSVVHREDAAAPNPRFVSVSGFSAAQATAAPQITPSPTPRHSEHPEPPLRPRLDGAPLLMPPLQSELLTQARRIVEHFDPQNPRLDPALGAFSLAAEARSDPRLDAIGMMLRYSKALQTWKSALEKYKKSDAAAAQASETPLQRLQNLLAQTHQDFWTPYTKTNAQLTDVLLKDGGNCDLQSTFLPALVAALNIPLPPHQKLLLQIFRGHVQPVLYDGQKNTVLDLAHNTVATGTPVPLYDPTILVQGWLKQEGLRSPKKDSDFVTVPANIAPDPRLVVSGHNDGTDTDTIHELPDPGVRWNNDDVPDHAVMAAPDILHPKAILYGDNAAPTTGTTAAASPLTALPAEAPLGSGGIVALLQNEKTAFPVGGAATDVKITFADTVPETYVTYDAKSATLTLQFPTQADAEKAAAFSNDVDLLAFAFGKIFEETSQNSYALRGDTPANLDRRLAEDLAHLKGPLDDDWDASSFNLVIPSSENVTGFGSLPPQLRKQVVSRLFPHFAQGVQEARAFQARIEQEPWRALQAYVSAEKKHPHTSPYASGYFSNLIRVMSYVHEDDLIQNAKQVHDIETLHQDIDRSMLDYDHVAWTAADRARPPQATPTPAPEATPEPPFAAAGSPAAQEPPPEPTYVPKRPIVIQDPVDVLSSLETLTRNGDADLPLKQQEAVARLWTKNFTNALFKRLRSGVRGDPHATGELIDRISKDLPTFVRSFPKNQRCQVYGLSYSGTETKDQIDLSSFDCVPTEIGRLEMLVLSEGFKEIPQKMGNGVFSMYIAGTQVSVTAQELLQGLEFQLGVSGRSSPAWLRQKHK